MMIIMFVASLLLSSMTICRDKAKQATCINNQYQLAKAMILFATDTEKFPTTLGQLDHKYLPWNPEYPGSTLLASQTLFTSAYYDYVTDLKHCPKVEPNEDGSYPVSYGINLYITNRNYEAINEPSDTVMTADSDVLYLENADQGAKRHAHGVIASYADGHVIWLKEIEPFSSMETQASDSDAEVSTLPPSDDTGSTDTGSTPPSTDDGSGSSGNNGVGNGEDPAPPGDPPINDGPGTSPGDPGNQGGTPSDSPPVVASDFDLDKGTVSLNYDSTLHVQILSAQYAIDQENWYDMYVDAVMTLPGGEEIVQNIVGGSGVNGGMTAEELEQLAWTSDAYQAQTTVDIKGTSKYWEKVKKKGKWVWVQKTKSSYDTGHDLDRQVWVLKDGDVVPSVPGLWNQISVGESVEPYTEVGSDGIRRMKLSENQVIYFFEMGQTSPYKSNGQVNLGYDMNDLVVLMDVNKV